MRYRYQLIIDPEFESLVPPLSQEEYSQLEANILRDGCRDPITIWDNVILDGHNRYKICRQHDILFNVNPILIENRDEAISWICSNQMGRRNLTDERRRYLIGILISIGIVCLSTDLTAQALLTVGNNFLELIACQLLHLLLDGTQVSSE